RPDGFGGQARRICRRTRHPPRTNHRELDAPALAHALGVPLRPRLLYRGMGSAPVERTGVNGPWAATSRGGARLRRAKFFNCSTEGSTEPRPTITFGRFSTPFLLVLVLVLLASSTKRATA